MLEGGTEFIVPTILIVFCRIWGSRAPQRVSRLLAGLGLSYEHHKVFQVAEEKLVVNFAVRADGHQLIIESSYTGARHGVAISALKRICVYMDFRFTQLKASDPKPICVAFIEAAQVYGDELKEVVKPILAHADGFAVSEEELGTELCRLLSSS